MWNAIPHEISLVILVAMSPFHLVTLFPWEPVVDYLLGEISCEMPDNYIESWHFTWYSFVYNEKRVRVGNFMLNASYLYSYLVFHMNFPPNKSKRQLTLSFCWGKNLVKYQTIIYFCSNPLPKRIKCVRICTYVELDKYSVIPKKKLLVSQLTVSKL